MCSLYLLVCTIFRYVGVPGNTVLQNIFDVSQFLGFHTVCG